MYAVNFPKELVRQTAKQMLQSGILIPDLRTLNVFTTDRCNFSCFYCSRNVLDESPDAENRYDDKSEFHTEDLRLLLDKYPTIRSVSFIGIGEPFLIRDLLPMAELSKQRGKEVRVVTNGSLLHRYWGRIGLLFDQVSVSLHGLTADELNTIAKVKENIFNQFVENVRYLVVEERKLNPRMKVRASVVLLKQNLERVRKAAQFCVDNSIPELDLQNYLPIGPEASQNCMFDDDAEDINFVKRLIRDYEPHLKINPPVLIRRDESRMRWRCTTFFTHLRVDGLGQVSGCSRIMVPKEGNGNFRTENVWENEYFNDMRKKFRTRQDLPTCCRYCPEAQ